MLNPFPRSLRLRLVVATIVVEVVTLAVLVANSLRVNDHALLEQAQTWVSSTAPLLNAALAAPLAQRDYATVVQLLEEMRSEHALPYLVVLDHDHSVVAAAGRNAAAALPESDRSLRKAGGDAVYDTVVPLTLAGRRYGTLALGVSTAFLQRAQKQLLMQSLLVSGIGVSASLLVLTLLALWITRHLRRLTNAGAAVAAGDFSARVEVTSADEVGALSAAFNTMAGAVQDKIRALADGETRLSEALRELEKANAVQREYLTQAAEERARLNALLSAMQVGILLVDRDNRVIYSNPAFEKVWLLARTRVRFLGEDAAAVLAKTTGGSGQPEVAELASAAREGQPSPPLEIAMSDGRLITRTGYPVRDATDQAIGYLWLFQDVTRERQTANQILYLAERDPLTGLYNRHRFQEELARTLSGSGDRRRRRVALLFFDIDEFKHVNDNFGHRAGDALLIRVAGEVSAQVRRNELFARLGGDEFAILAPDMTDQEASVVAERIVRAIGRIPFSFEGNHLRLTCSLGVAIYPDHAPTAEDLVAHADAAMYQAKEAGKNTWRIYSEHVSGASRQMIERLSWNERIEDALEHHLLRLHFQGVFACGDLSLRHLEALVRMVDRTAPQQVIMPGSFIPVAEKTGKILDIDRWVIAACVRTLARHPQVSAIALNISGRSLSEPGLPQYIIDQLKHQGVQPARLVVELTETSAVSDLHDAQRLIDALRSAGCKVCLDDFGSGFSSFTYLKHLDVDMVKIDGQFIRDLPADRSNQVFVRAMVDVARGLHKTTVAESVEDARTLEMLHAFGVDYAQGYHLEKPQERHPLLQPREPT